MFTGLAAPLLCLLLLGAHFLRFGDHGLAAACLALGLLLGLRRRAIGLAVAGTLLAGTALWAHTAGDMVGWRLAVGQPWLRSALILGGVALLTLLAALGLLAGPGKRLHTNVGKHDAARAALFLVTAGLLLAARHLSPLPVLLADRYLPGWGGLEVFGLALYAAWIGGRMLSAKRTAGLRLGIWALFSALFFGQLALGLAGLNDMLMTDRLHLPVPALIAAGPVYRGGGYFMPILFLSTLLLVGPAWCSHLCYVGAWDGLAARGRRPGKPVPKAWLLWGRLGILAGCVAAALGLRLAGAGPLVAVWIAAGFGLGGVAVILLVSRRRGLMVHCTAWCPMGLAANLLGRINPMRVRLDPDCTECGVCASAKLGGCRYSALQPEDIKARRPGLSCTLCGDCVTACPHSKARYAFPGLTPNRARALFIVLAVSLHAVFMGVARI